MSLKAFHILFVTLSTMVSAGFGLWCVAEFRHSGSAGMALAAAGAAAGAAALVVYGVLFYRKIQDSRFT